MPEGRGLAAVLRGTIARLPYRIWYFRKLSGARLRGWFWFARWQAHLGGYPADRLTGFRRYQEMQRQLNSSAGSALFLDIDRLQQINDWYGMARGDQALSQAASVLAGDSVNSPRRVHRFRFGGDDFVLLIPGADLSEAEAIADAVQTGLGKSEVASLYQLTATIAVLLYSKTEDRDALCGRARVLLTTGKRAGESIVVDA